VTDSSSSSSSSSSSTPARSRKATSLGRRFWLPWREGPAARHTGPLVVSLTDFRAHHARDLPSVYLAGLRLREGWYAMPGAIGLWLWGQPLQRRGGSLTIWESNDDLRRFVSLPAHVAIMRRYRDRGTIASDTWEMNRFEASLVRERAEARLG
jgi:heme-degrading monooxygenase HmoA